MFLPFVCSSDLITRALTDRGPWPGFSFKYDHILVGVPPFTSPAIEFVFLNNHLIQIPIIFCETI